MANVEITDFTVEKDIANATLSLSYRITFDDYDKVTNLGWIEAWRYIEDDTGFDLDLDAPDDQIGLGQRVIQPVRANGRDYIDRVRTRELAWADLNLDSDTWGGNEELRGEVTLTPVLPEKVVVESDVVEISQTAVVG
ncbi:MAG TPA: hypothetical protein VGC11_04340 [Acidimicrobiia bacterium]|jgi:hypothetical protein